MLLPLCSVCFCPAGARQLLQLNHHQALLLPLGERCRAPPQWQDMPSLGKHPASPSPLPPRCGTAKLTFFSAPLGEPQHQNVALQKTQPRSRAVPLGGLLHLPARGPGASVGQCGVLGAGLPHAWGEARSPSSGEALLPAAGCHHGEGPKSTTAPSQRGFLNKGVLSPSGLICANGGAAGPAVARRSLWAAPGSLQPSCLPCRRLDLHRARGQAGGPVRVPVTLCR